MKNAIRVFVDIKKNEFSVATAGRKPTKRALLILLIPFCCLSCSSSRSSWNMEPNGRIRAASIVETSGVVASRKFRDVLWVHNDSRQPAELFAVTEHGELIRRFRVPTAENRDWEDIALDLDNNLYILDNTSRSDPEHRNVIYILPEPDPYRDESVIPPRKISIRFPEGGFDCETIFVSQGKMYFVTKPWDGSLPRIYRCDDLENGGWATFAGTLPLCTMVTGGDISADGRRIALSSYRALMIFEGLRSPEALLQSEPLISPLNAGQVEAVSWKGDHLVLTNEQREIFWVPRSSWERQEAPFLQPPRTSVPFVGSKPSVHQNLQEWHRGRWLEVDQMGKQTKIGRVAWSQKGLHVGIRLPEKTRLRFLGPEPPGNFGDWFEPGSVYLMINPSGSRPLTFEEGDRCLIVGRGADGQATVRARYLRPGTFVESTEISPPWIQIEEQEHRLLMTLEAGLPEARPSIPLSTVSTPRQISAASPGPRDPTATSEPSKRPAVVHYPGTETGTASSTRWTW